MTLTRRSIAFTLIVLTAGAAALGVAQSSSRGDGRDATRLADALTIREGSTVGEIGGGDGALAIAVSRIVGDRGRVFVTELGEARLATLSRAIDRAKASNVQVLAADARKTNLEPGCCDAVFMRNVYHHFDDPETMNVSLYEALQPGGMLGIMDFAPRGTAAVSAADRDTEGNHGVAADAVTDELRNAGFEIVSSETADDRDIFVVARKPER